MATRSKLGTDVLRLVVVDGTVRQADVNGEPDIVCVDLSQFPALDAALAALREAAAGDTAISRVLLYDEAATSPELQDKARAEGVVCYPRAAGESPIDQLSATASTSPDPADGGEDVDPARPDGDPPGGSGSGLSWFENPPFKLPDDQFQAVIDRFQEPDDSDD